MLLREDGVWQTILKKKIDRLKSIVPSVQETEGLSFWAGLIATRKLFINFGSFIIKYYPMVRFSEDKWWGNNTYWDNIQLYTTFSVIKVDTIAAVMVFYT
jgi:hypothetical protein